MNAMRERLLPQPLIGIVTATVAVAAVTVCWFATPSFAPAMAPRLALLAMSLMAAVVAANRFPVHIRHNTKLNVSSVPLYLTAVFLPPALAALVAGIAVLLGELSVRRMRRTYLCDLVTDSGRWTIMALGGSLLAHIPVGHEFQILPLAATAIVLWAGDIVTSPLLLGPACQESPGRLIRQIVRDAGLSEGSQYLVGFVGAIAALHQLWAIALLTLPTALVYLATNRVKEVRRGTLEVLESMADAVDLRDTYRPARHLYRRPLGARGLSGAEHSRDDADCGCRGRPDHHGGSRTRYWKDRHTGFNSEQSGETHTRGRGRDAPSS